MIRPMFTQLRFIVTGAVLAAILASLGWGAIQHRRAASLSDRLDAAVSRAEGAERAMKSLQSHMAKMREQAEAADRLRAIIQENDDATPLPDWLGDVLGRLRPRPGANP